MKKTTLFLAAFFFQIVTQSFSAEVPTQQYVHGAGPSTKLVQLFFTEFEKLSLNKGYTFEIPTKSVKHSGGVMSSEKYLFGRTGRPLNEEEKKMNKGEIILGQVPAVIAVGEETGISSLEMDQLEKIVTGVYTNWKEVGGADAPIINVGREESEAVFMELKHRYSFFRSAKFNQTFSKDDEVVAFAQNNYGKYAMVFGAAPVFEGKKGISVVTIPGFSVGLKLGLVYDLSNKDNPLVRSAAEFAASGEWSAISAGKGFLALK